MEIITHYLLPLLLLSLSLILIFFIRKRGSGDLKKLPPGTVGWPILGENKELILSGFQQMVRERMKKHSPKVFKTSLMGVKMAVLCGEEGNKFLSKNEDKLLRRSPPLSLMKAMCPNLNRIKYEEPHVNFLQFDSMKSEALKHDIPAMDALAREHLQKHWRPYSEVKAQPLVKKLAFELLCKVFMNVVDEERLGKLLEPLSLLSGGILSVPINLPWTACNRAVRGGGIVRGEVMRMVKERRKEVVMGDCKGGRDFLTKMVALRNEDGKCVSDDKVADMIVGLFVAGQYEVSAAVTIVVAFLAELPHIYDQVLKEQLEIAKSKGPDQELAWEDVEKMKYTWNVACECFRLTPPSIGGFREATAEFTFAGFTVPEGWKVMWTPHSTHNNPNYFPEPEKFDPSRFEGSGPEPHTYVPFGVAARLCPGKGYAKLVILVFIHNMVTRFGFEKAIPNERMLFRGVSPTPAHGLPLRLRPHQQ